MTPARKGPPVTHPTSLALGALAVGQSWSQVMRFDGDELTKVEIRKTIEGLRNTTNGFIAKAKKRSGTAEFTSATFTQHTHDLDLLVGIVVTRTK